MGSKVLIGKKYKQTNQDYNFMNIDAKKEEIFSLLEKNWVFAQNSNVLIPTSLQPEDVNLWYFKLDSINRIRIHKLKYLRS